MALVGLVLLCSGCLKYDVELFIADDDTMSGTYIVGVAKEFATGQDVDAEAEDLEPTSGTITREPYEDDDYTGTMYTLDAVPIADVALLAGGSGQGGSLELVRDGDNYVFTGELNFNLGGAPTPDTEAALGSFSAMVSITFPGAVQDSNGTIDGNTATWTELEPTGSNELSATASAISNGAAAGPDDGGGIPWWVWALSGVVLLVIIGIVLMVFLRNRKTPAPTGPFPPGQWGDQAQAYGDGGPGGAPYGTAPYGTAPYGGGGYGDPAYADQWGSNDPEQSYYGRWDTGEQGYAGPPQGQPPSGTAEPPYTGAHYTGPDASPGRAGADGGYVGRTVQGQYQPRPPHQSGPPPG